MSTQVFEDDSRSVRRAHQVYACIPELFPESFEVGDGLNRRVLAEVGDRPERRPAQSHGGRIERRDEGLARVGRIRGEAVESRRDARPALVEQHDVARCAKPRKVEDVRDLGERLAGPAGDVDDRLRGRRAQGGQYDERERYTPTVVRRAILGNREDSAARAGRPHRAVPNLDRLDTFSRSGIAAGASEGGEQDDRSALCRPVFHPHTTCAGAGLVTSTFLG